MDILIKFMKKPLAGTKKYAIKIAERNNSREEDDFVIVNFNSFSEDCKEITRIISSYKVAEIFIDGKKIRNISSINAVLNCETREFCDGGINRCSPLWNGLYNLIYNLGCDLTTIRSTIEHLREYSIYDYKIEPLIKENILIKTGDNLFKINKEKIKEAFKEATEKQYLYLCDKFNPDKIFQEIDNLPEEIDKSRQINKEKEKQELRNRILEEIKQDESENKEEF